MSPSERQGEGKPELREAWSLASDEEIVSAAFPEQSDFSNEALAAVYREFVRRGLSVPERPGEHPPDHPGPPTRFSMGVRAFGVYCATSSVWCALLAATGILTLWGWGVTWALVFLGIILPPGLLAIWYMLRWCGRYQPDPEGHTHCGRCGYILRGLREPRCPECGTRI